MSLVAHHAPDVEPGGAGTVGEMPGVVDVAATPGEADVDVDEHGADAAGDRRVERCVGVDRHRDVRPVGERSESPGVERLVREQEVVGQASGDEALDLPGCRRAEAVVAVGVEPLGHVGRLERLDVGTESRARQHGVHRRQVAVERRDVDEQRRGDEIVRGRRIGAHAPIIAVRSAFS